jgi:hypothetical protein
MASGILGQSKPTASTNTTVYTVPASKLSSFSVNMTNFSATSANVTLAVSATATPTNSEYILHSSIIPPFSTLEKTGLVAQAGKNVVINTTGNSIAVTVCGYEE